MSALLMAAMLSAGQDTSARWAPLAGLIEEAVRRQAFPGAVVAVGRRDTMLYLRAFGRVDYQDGPAVEPGTVYDVASLTKVVGLTTALMQLVEAGRVELDAPVGRYLAPLGGAGDSTVTIRRLLTHSAGHAAWKPYYSQAASREEVFRLAAAEPLEYAPGTRMVYSDVGVIILTRVVETVTAERLDRYLSRALFTPLGMNRTRFNPPRSWRSRIAPTEVDGSWRGRLVHGQVHDENAAAMGGVSGHAGLFSTAQDLARFAQMILRGGTTPGGRRLLRAETVRLFTEVQEPALSHRALGWETANGQNSAGSRLSLRAVGHTGFTGVSLWIDPEQDLFVILLTNRVHPTRENTQIFEVRRRVADAAAQIAGAS